MASTQYYEKIKHLQDTRQESERQRLELEGRLNSYIKSDDRLAKLKAVRLQGYWKKICDDETRSRQRNEQLLREFDRVEAHMATLAERTQRQQRIKEDYEAYIERMYPNWQEKVMAQSVGGYCMPQPATQPFLQFHHAGTPHAGQQPLHVGTPHAGQQPQHVGTPHAGQQPQLVGTPHAGQQPQHVGTPHAGQQPQLVGTPHVAVSFSQDTGNGMSTTFVSPTQSHTVSAPAPVFPHKGSAQGRDRECSYWDYSQEGPMSPGEFLPLLQQVPGKSAAGQPGRRDDPMNPSSPQLPVTLRSPRQTTASTNAVIHENRDVDVPTACSALPSDGSTAVMTDLAVVGSSSSHLPPQQEWTNYNRSRSQGMAGNQLMEEFVSVTSRETSPSRAPEKEGRSADVMSQNSDSSDKLRHSPTNSTAAGNKGKAKIRGVTKKHKETDGEGRGSGGADDYTTVLRAEYQSGMSLASSDSERFTVRAPVTLDSVHESLDINHTHSPEPVNTNAESTRQQSMMSVSLHSRVIPQPDLTLDGFYYLLTAIQDDLPRTTSPEAYYRSLVIATSLKKEIILNANKGATLSHVNSASISMVVKDQLPLLAANCDTGALLPDKIFTSVRNIETLTEFSVRAFIHPTCRQFWDKLYDHMVLLRRHDVMSARDIAELFSELIISESSRHEEKAVLLLTSLLDHVEVTQSPGSTSTSFVTPRRPGVTSGDVVRAAMDFKDDDDDDDDDDDFFNQPLPIKSVVSLKDSSVYKQLKDNTLKTQSLNSQSHDIDDEVDDEFDDLLSPQGTGHQMTYNTTEGNNTTSHPTSPRSMGTTGGYLTSGLGSTSNYEYDHSGLESTGDYLPSGLDTGNSKSADKGTVSRGAADRSINQSAALKFGIADEDDVKIPTNKVTPEGGTLEDEEDEFEFYT